MSRRAAEECFAAPRLIGSLCKPRPSAVATLFRRSAAAAVAAVFRRFRALLFRNFADSFRLQFRQKLCGRLPIEFLIRRLNAEKESIPAGQRKPWVVEERVV